ncbi:hypothetical protein [Actinacidiphila glaucinigra]|uniref:hypothetical protein n=1 Tax=Actinacidiphila glaucinigra TaxID=235986 RepID=UPI0035D78ACD
MSEFPAGEAFSSTAVVRAWEPPEEVVVSVALAHSEGLQPEDYGVLIRLLLRDPHQPSSVLALSEEFQESGWKMGEKRLREVMKRLKAAGHVQHLRQYNPATQRPEWQFHVYRNPANNAAYARQAAEAFPQVSPIGQNSADRSLSGVSDPAETGVCAGQPDRAEFGGSAPTWRNSADRNEGVSAGQADQAEFGGSELFPPHTPPGGLVNPPTLPPRPTTPGSVVAAVAGGDIPRSASNTTPAAADAGLTEAELSAAAEFLADLPGRWACGPQDVDKYAVLLAEAVKRQGWPLDAELERWLTADERSIRGAYPRVIPARLRNLPRYSAWQRTAAPAGPAADHKAPVEDACPVHPSRAAAECLPCRSGTGEQQMGKPVERTVPEDAIARARAAAGLPAKASRPDNGRGTTARDDARSRRKAAAARAARMEAEAEENRRKAASLLENPDALLPGAPVLPGQVSSLAGQPAP